MFVVAPQAAQVLNKNYGRPRPARKQKDSGVSSSCFDSGRPARVFVLKVGRLLGPQQTRGGRLEFRLQLAPPDPSVWSNSRRPTLVFVLKLGQSAGQQQARVGRLEFRLQPTSPDENCLLSLAGRWVRPPTLLLPAASPANYTPPDQSRVKPNSIRPTRVLSVPHRPGEGGRTGERGGDFFNRWGKNSCRRTQVQNKKKDPTPSVMSAGSITPGQANTPRCGFKTDSRQFWGWTVCTIWKLSEYRAW